MWKVYEDYLNRVFLPLTESTRLLSLFKAYDQEKGHGCKSKGSKKKNEFKWVVSMQWIYMDALKDNFLVMKKMSSFPHNLQIWWQI